MSSKNIAECVRFSAELEGISESARLDTEVLLAHALGKNRTYLYTWPEEQVATEAFAHFQAMLHRRQQGEPVAYIIGEQEFWSLPLYVNPSTLIPRPDTECLVEKALPYIRDTSTSRVLDLGTGTGAIALAIAQERARAAIVASDVSAEAVALAKRNVARHGAKHVQVIQSHWFEAIEGVFDLIVSNPPYIDDSDAHLHRGDVRYEPRSALVAGEKGLSDLKQIVIGAREYLKPGAYLMVEHGWQQGEVVRALFVQAGYQEVATGRDYGGNDRICAGRYQQS